MIIMIMVFMITMIVLSKARFEPSWVILLGSSEERKVGLKIIKVGKRYQGTLEYSR